MIYAVKLSGANYLIWSKSIKVVLRAKKKLKFLLKDLPPETTFDYVDWISADAYVLSWLWRNMEPHIASNVQWCEPAGHLLKNPIHRSGVARIYELYELLFTTK